MLEKFLNIFRIPDLRKRVLFMLGILAVYRLGAWIPTPGVDTHMSVSYTHLLHLVISGIDRQKVGQVAADMRSLRKPDPYKNKGVRYSDEKLKKKAGKTGAK